MLEILITAGVFRLFLIDKGNFLRTRRLRQVPVKFLLKDRALQVQHHQASEYFSLKRIPESDTPHRCGEFYISLYPGGFSIEYSGTQTAS
ncbi:hypothetical protein D3C75_1200250 [compost metagenome]